jgi:small subunit ribosomal protein S1
MSALTTTEATANKKPASTTHSLKRMLNEYSLEQPKRGQLLEGEILHMDESSVILDVGAKRDAIVPRRELERIDEEHLQDMDVGDQVPVFVLRTPTSTEPLLVSLERGREKLDWDRAKEALDAQEVLELEVIDQNRGGLVVRFGKLRGFVPNSHIPKLREKVRQEEDLFSLKEEFIGSKMLLNILEIDRKKRKFVLSAKSARAEARRRIMRGLNVGQVIHGKVVNMVPYGAFVDIGGVDGLIHISELAWHRIKEPSEIISLGDKVEVMIKSVDLERERIGLSRKALLPGPWESVYDRYQVGSLVEGTIANICNFGIFVKFPDGIEALLHKSELDIIGPGVPQDLYQRGDTILVRVLSIDPIKKRMSLSVRQVTYEEQVDWMEGKKTTAGVDG